MTKKIRQSVFLVAVTILCISFAAVLGVLNSYFTRIQKEQLQGQMELAAQGVEHEGVSYLEDLILKEYRITFIDQTGEVLFDSEADVSVMENHWNRQEIEEAFRTGRGESSRYSDTMTEKTLYLAERLSSGDVLRVSVGYETVFALLLRMFPVILLILMVAVALSILFANRLSKHIVAPLNSLNLEQPLENDAYEELSPLLLHIAEQQIQIKQQMEELENSKIEFQAITESMSEGLILLNKSGKILSINKAAKKLFMTSDECIGKDFLAIERHPHISKCIAKAAETGHGETVLERDGRVYQLLISKISTEYRISGLALICIDITDKVLAEQVRREFSANVSHELKTPLQSILGSTELIEGGFVKEEELPRFVGHIRTEATRLMTLINDIIRLSQLDEVVEVPTEEVDLYELVQEVFEVLQTLAEERKVSFLLEGKTMIVKGVRQYLYEIIYNLCDNAVRYNVENGMVKVAVAAETGRAKVTVSDTGIGIAPEHQERIFERFYRVDKSHSKETGGTGLGLSIVKHAVKQCGAELTIQSKPKEGTTICVLIS